MQLNSEPFPIILGPCVIESLEILHEIAQKLQALISKLQSKKPDLIEGVEFFFKASFDKANRTSIDSYRGPGLKKGLEMLLDIKNTFGFRVVSDIHEAAQAKPAAEVLDIIQIPAFLCRQTDLIVEAAKTGKTLNIKKGQFLSPIEVKNIYKKCKDSGNEDVWICERGSSFGYNNLVVDMRSFEQIREFGIRTIFDATHSCQMPGAGGDKSLGNSRFAPVLAKAAVAAGAEGIFAEVHPRPEEALSDGPNMISIENLDTFLIGLLSIRQVTRNIQNDSGNYASC
jgi:2-dehydro-3-deoxyphosphooctonate aldolase (KDO 8-P synthase)